MKSLLQWTIMAGVISSKTWKCDHTCRTLDSEDKEKKGHPLPCSSGCCTSRLYTLRAAAVHYPILKTLLNNIYRARRSHCGIRDIECGLSEGSVSSLLDDEQSATTEGEYFPPLSHV